MRSLVLLALAALLLAPAVADARKRGPRARGAVTALAAGFPGALTALQRPAARPAGPGATAPAPGVPEPPLPPPPPLPTGSGRALMVTTDDADPAALRLTLSRPSVLAGAVKITLNNANGEDPHNLVLGKGADSVLVFEHVAAESVAVATVALAAGTWTAYCALDGHQAKGMSAQLSVVAPV